MNRQSIPVHLRQPHCSPATSPTTVMRDVFVALLPALGMSVYFYGVRVLILTAISIASCVGFEVLYLHLCHKPRNPRDFSPWVTGLLLALILPVAAAYWVPVLGGFFAIVVGKQLYGGLGRNFMNPALCGRMILNTFPFLMTTWAPPMEWLPLTPSVDVVSTATPMSYLKNHVLPPFSLSELALGYHGGSMGELSAVMLLLGGGYLLLRRVISPRIPVAFLGTVAVLTFCTPQDGTSFQWMMAQLCSGGVILGAVFMTTDPVTSPTTPRGQMIYGICCGGLTVLLRYYGAYPDGVGWAILTMNCGVWLLDHTGLPRRMGAPHFQRVRRVWKTVQEDLSQIHFQRPNLPQEGEMPGEAHLDQFRTFGRSAVALISVILVTSLVLAGANRSTELLTHQQSSEQQMQLLTQVMPQANMISKTAYRTPDALAVSAGFYDSTLIGYCIEVQSPGFGGLVTMTVGVDIDGKVTGVAVTDHNETLNLGTKALTQGYFHTFVGRSGTLDTRGENHVDTISGATVTSNAIVDGVNRALSVVANLHQQDIVEYSDGEV